MKHLLLSATCLFGAALAGCGDIGAVDLKLQFSDASLEASTRRIELVVRKEPTVPPGTKAEGCKAIWSTEATGLPETRSYVDYPNKNDVLGAPVALGKYEELSFFAYALSSRDPATANVIGGGCVDVAIDASQTTEVAVRVDRPSAK